MGEDEGYYGPDDNLYCERCFDRDFDYCPLCGEAYTREYMTYVDSISESICNGCLDRRFDACDKCGEYHKQDNVKQVGEKYLCEDCRENATP